MKSHKFNFWRMGNRVGLFLGALFILCFAWYFINPVLQELHLDLLRLTFIGYAGMNIAGFVSGFIQSYIWGYILAGIWKLVGCCKENKK